MKKTILLGFLCAMSCAQTFAQGTVPEGLPVSYEYSKRIKTGAPEALSQGLFGEQVSQYDGSTYFSVTDIDIPGNNALPVKLTRRFSVEGRPVVVTNYDARYGGLGDWSIEVPFIASTYPIETGGYQAALRCSGGAIPSSLIDGLYRQEFWSGIDVSIPGRGETKLLSMTAMSSVPRPIDGVTRTHTTSERDAIDCIPMKGGLAGQGFRVTTTGGVRYFFDIETIRKDSPLETVIRSLDGFDGLRKIVPRNRYYLLPSRVEDRFGNFVTYQYNAVGRPTNIASNDGREINLTYQGDLLVSASSNGRVWNYTYLNSGPEPILKTTTQPDGSQWEYSQTGSLRPDAHEADDLYLPECGFTPQIGGEFQLNIRHPSGASGKFDFLDTRHFRSGVHVSECVRKGSVPEPTYALLAPNYYDTYSITKKSISGLGISGPQDWNYNFQIADHVQDRWGNQTTAFNYPCTTCATSKTTKVTNPDGSNAIYTYGILYKSNEGRLLGIDTQDASGALLSSERSQYVTDAQVAQSGFFGEYGMLVGGVGNPVSTMVRPLIKREVVQQGVNFVSTVNSFDTLARATSITKSSSLGYSRTDTTTYYDDLNKWWLGQVKTVTNTDAGTVLSKTDYDPITALPLRNYSFGQTTPDTTLTYLPDGNISTVKDALNRIATLSNYYRGVPRLVTFQDATTVAATVNPTGTIASTTDQLGSVTQYTYDLMDRIASITPPTGDTVAWTSTTQTFAINTVAAYGLPAGHWKQTISKGNYRKEIYFNAMWQPVVTREYDNSNIASTQRFTRMAYDTSGRPVFASYPGTTDALITGVRTEYDALGRVTKTKQDSELLPNLGVLNTTIEYLIGFQTRVTNPRGFATTTSYQVFDIPDTSRPEIIVSPQGITTTMLRNVYGNTLSVTRSGVWNNAPLNSTRSYVYDSQQRLCKRIEPETGATIMDYDAVGNLAWSVQGSTLTSNTCDRASVAAADKTVRTYNTMNRLVTTDVPGSANDLSYEYFADGALKMLTSGTNRWDYTYNKLRLPVTEQLTIDSRVKTLTHAYNSMAQESSLTYPSGLVVATTPNALGQVSQAGTFATGVNYHPMGGMSIFNYGNGIEHSTTPNTRMLPTLSKDMNGTIAILHDTYAFDANGNVASITDGTAGAGGNRTMSYDNADRLTQTIAPNLAWMSNTFSYDALDNIRANTLGGRAHTYQYNATTKRLDQLTLPNATVARNLAYDAQGNVTSNGAQSYVFDKANRMESVNGIESYQYDGHGRRVKTIRSSDGKTSYPIYSLEGKLVTEDDQRSNKTIDYVYLNGSLVAKRSAAIGSTTYITSYQHTDSLGSPVAESDAAKTVTFIKRYTPYGEPSDQNYVQGPGFTGHVTDAATGLTYAQQRYYDPMLGRFLSPDPMPSDMNNAWNFNRYNYAGNNPYRFKDPDGRACTGTHIKSVCDSGGVASMQTSARSIGPIGSLDLGGKGTGPDVKKTPIKPVAKKEIGGQGIQAGLAVGPSDASDASDIGHWAKGVAAKTGLPGDRNGPRDAFRHCAAMCRIARDQGPEDAILLGDIHEAWVPNPADETHMDMFNNRFGAEHQQSGQPCAGMCLKAVNTDQLIVLPESRWVD